MRFLVVLFGLVVGLAGFVVLFSGLVLAGSGGVVGGAVACDLDTCSPLETCPASYVSGGDCYYNLNYQTSCQFTSSTCGEFSFCVYDNVDSTQPTCYCAFEWSDPSRTNEVMLRDAPVVCDGSSGWVCDWDNAAERLVCNSALECVTKYCGPIGLEVGYTCVFTGVRWDWLTPEQMPAEVCDDGFDNDCDGAVDCADPDCAGQTGPNGVTCCASDADCTGYGPNNLILVCDCPDSASCSLQKNQDYTCKEKTTCSDSSECAPNYCCDTYVNLGTCVGEGTVINVNGVSYLCDPVAGGFVDEQGNLADVSPSMEASNDWKNLLLIFGWPLVLVR